MKRLVTLVLMVSLLVGYPAASVSAAPANAVVGNGTSGSCDQTSLHNALLIGGVITFSCGGAKTILLASPETISLHTTLEGANLITLDGQEATRLFVVNAGIRFTLHQIVLRGARASGSHGGAIVNHGALTLDHATIYDSATDTSHSGGAIFSDGPVTLTSSLLYNNFAGNGGALFANGAQAKGLISGSEFYGNHADNPVNSFGGGIAVGSLAQVTINGGSQHNQQASYGGALYLASDSVVTITNGLGATALSNNQAFVSGGAIYNEAGDLTIVGALLQNNHVPTNTILGGVGGAIFNQATLSLQSSVVQSNQAKSGGGLYSFGSLTLLNTDWLSNTSQFPGGGVYSNDGLVVTGGRFQNNRCAGDGCTGGGMYVDAPVTLTNTQFVNNHSSGSGGGLYAAGNVTMQGGLFQGNGCDYTDCDGGGLASGLSVWLNGTQLLSNTAAYIGGGAFADAHLAAAGSRFQNNQCVQALCLGGGLGANDLALTNTQIISNAATGQGGGAWAAASASLLGGTVSDNKCVVAGCAGGGFYAGGGLAVDGTQFTNNASDASGGGLYAAGGVTVANALFQGNRCNGTDCDGGGLASGQALELNGTQLLANAAAYAGGGAYAGGRITVLGGRFANNQCTQFLCPGGGLFGGGALVLTGTQFLTNTSSGDGGGLNAAGPVTVTEAFFQGNRCTDVSCYGGGLASFGAVRLTRSDFTNNTAASRGGAFFSGLANVQGGIFRENHCLNDGCWGGALFASGTLALAGAQFIHNGSNGIGGGVYAQATAQVVNTLLARNSAATSGAALYLSNNSTVRHVTIAGPASSSSAALTAAGGTVGISDTIITSYTTGIQLAGGSAFEDYNLFLSVPTHTAGGVTSGGHSFNGNPGFAAAASDDYHLWTNSAAKDAGVDVGVAVDADGDARPQDGGFDIGYDEYFLRLIFLAIVRR